MAETPDPGAPDRKVVVLSDIISPVDAKRVMQTTKNMGGTLGAPTAAAMDQDTQDRQAAGNRPLGEGAITSVPQPADTGPQFESPESYRNRLADAQAAVDAAPAPNQAPAGWDDKPPANPDAPQARGSVVTDVHGYNAGEHTPKSNQLPATPAPEAMPETTTDGRAPIVIDAQGTNPAPITPEAAQPTGGVVARWRRKLFGR